jgi:pimeloyl-ACP methyl ester carboxylesterase
MKSKQILFNGSKIFYRITGKGKPVVLIHGFGEDGDIWQKQIQSLQEHYLLIVPDLPGSGRSELVPGANIETYSEIIKEIFTTELQNSSPTGGGRERAVLMGHSMGGYITLAFAEKYPELISSFGLVHSSAFADSEEKKAARLKSIEFIKKHGAYEFLKPAIMGLFGEYWSKNHQPEIDTLVEKSKNFTSDALVQYYQAMIARHDKTGVLKNFPHLILFIIGVHDNAVPFAQSLKQSYLPNLSYIHILRNSAHMGMWEEAERVNAALLEFLKGQPV